MIGIKLNKIIGVKMQNIDLVSFVLNGLFSILLVIFGLYIRSILSENKTLKKDFEDRLRNCQVYFQNKELCSSFHKNNDAVISSIQSDIKEIKDDIKDGFSKIYNRMDEKLSNSKEIDEGLKQLAKAITESR